MCPHSVIGLVCADTRQELGHQETIVGVYPDNINVPSFPGAFPKLCFYVRFHLDLKSKPKSISVRIDRPDDREPEINKIDEEIISQAFEEAEKKGAPFCGIISRMTMAPFPVDKPGRFNIVVLIDEDELVCGTFFIQEKESS